MNFLYPGFLFALLAIAIPIAIHLFNFRKFKRVYFSNVAFLKEAKEQNSSREKLKHLLVLFSRMLAIAFLVLAFARPYFSTGTNLNPGTRSVVNIYIDNSYSMETVNKEGSLLDEAKRKAKEIAASYGLNDQFQLLSNDFEGRHQRLVSPEEFIGLLDELKISATGRSLQQVINRQQSDLGSDRNQQSYILSDFQKSFVGNRPLQLDSTAQYRFVKLNANSLPNIAVDTVWSASPVHQPGQAEKLVVQLRNYGEEEAKGIPLKLMINGQQKALSNISVPPGEAVKDTLSFSGLVAGWQKAVLSIKDFPLTFDDELNFSFEVKSQMQILEIKGDLSQSYIRALYGADPYFKLTEMPESGIRYSEFSKYSLIVMSGLKNPSSGLAQQLKSYVQNGGSVVLFPDLDASSSVYTAFLNGLGLPAVKELISGAGVSSSIELKNPLFKDVFGELPKNMDLPVANRYFTYLDQSRSGKQEILQLPLGRSLFASYGFAAGKVYLSAVSLDLKDSNLPRHPIFLPMMYKAAFASAREQPLYYTTGSSETLESQRISLLKNQTLKLVSGEYEVIPELRQTADKTLLYVADQVRQSGFYDLKKGDSTLAVMAFNDDRTESDMHYASEKELKALLGQQQASVFDSRKDAKSLKILTQNNNTELWKLCLILGLVFLAIEILLIRFFNHKKQITTS